MGCISGDEAPTALSAHLISYQTMIFCSLFLSGLSFIFFLFFFFFELICFIFF